MNKEKLSLLRLILLATVGITSVAAAPVFGPSGVTMAGLKPGSKVAWLAIERTPVDHHSRRSTLKGVAVATPAGLISIGHSEAAASSSLWVFASLDEDLVEVGAPANVYPSPAPIETKAVPGTDKLIVRSSTIDLLYVSRRGSNVWSYQATDGGASDADGVQNAEIEIPLHSLRPMNGQSAPPRVISEGDVVLMIDSRRNRVSTLKVKP